MQFQVSDVLLSAADTSELVHILETAGVSREDVYAAYTAAHQIFSHLKSAAVLAANFSEGLAGGDVPTRKAPVTDIRWFLCLFFLVSFSAASFASLFPATGVSTRDMDVVTWVPLVGAMVKTITEVTATPLKLFKLIKTIEELRSTTGRRWSKSVKDIVDKFINFLISIVLTSYSPQAPRTSAEVVLVSDEDMNPRSPSPLRPLLMDRTPSSGVIDRLVAAQRSAITLLQQNLSSLGL
jgi:hypothetical protein